jgi:DNA-binding CsgD family transcriptional regulator
MALCNQPMSDYRVVRIQQVVMYLKRGYRLYGQAFCVRGDHLVQCLVKVEQTPLNLSILTPIERQCLRLWVQGDDHKTIAQKVHRAYRTVGRIMQRVRDKYHCPTPQSLRHLVLSLDPLEG